MSENQEQKIYTPREAVQKLSISIAALLRTLPPEAWEWRAVHPERGEISLYDIFQLYLEHGNIHLAQVERLKQSL